MAVIDASVWVAYFHPQDKFHRQAIQVMKKLIDSHEEIRLPNIAALEVAGAIRRITGLEKDAENALISMEGLDCEYIDVDSIKLLPAAISIAIKQACRGTDALYIAVALFAKDTLWTFDNTQRECGRNIVFIEVQT